MKLTPHAPLAALALILPMLSACSNESDQPTIAAGFYPLAWVADEIAGDHYDVVNLTTPGGEAHDLELTTKETAVVARADLLIYESGFQPGLDTAAETVAEGEVLDVTSVVELRPVGAGADEAHDEETHADEEDHGDEEDAHDHGDLDPHFWLDPILLADYGKALAERLGTLDPDNADLYADKAASLHTKLSELDASFDEGLATCERDTVVVSHDAFGYWSKYGLTMEAINGLSPDAEPTPADLARLQKLIKDDGVTTVFSERLLSAKMAQTLAADTGVTTAVLDPIEGLADDTSDEDYLSLMDQNLQALRKANSCS